MNKIIQYFLLALTTITLSTTSMFPELSDQSIISKAYCHLLGNQDAQPRYSQMAYQALKDLGIEDPSLSIPVKKMNGVGPAFARIALSSFTAFGIWLDEDYLDTCSDEEKLFHIYHEASHYALNHHQKVLGGCGITILLLAAGLITLNSSLTTFSPCIKNASIVCTGALATLGCYFYVLPHFIKQQEKEADILAARTLKALSKQDIVETHIQQLKNTKNPEDKDIWWYSANEQIKYLEEVLITKAPL